MNTNSGGTILGIDREIGFALTAELDPARVLSFLTSLRRASVSVRAIATATKCLDAIYHFRGDDKLSVARKAAKETPSADRWLSVALQASASGRRALARSAYLNCHASATACGDLDLIADAEDGIADRLQTIKWSTPAAPFRFRDAIRRAMAMSRSDVDGAINELQRLRQRALRLKARWTASTCMLHMTLVISDTSEAREGIRYARYLVRERPVSYSYLALGYCQERANLPRNALASYSEALRRAYREGDIHYAQHACGGLKRAGASGTDLRAQWQQVATRFSWQPEDWTRPPRCLGAIVGMPA